MQIIDASADTLRRLATLRTDGVPVLSLYLNLDPSTFPTPQARRTELESLLAEAERAYLKDDHLSHDQKLAFREELQTVRQFFEGHHFTIEGARGVAVFCSTAAGLFEVLRLSRAVESRVVVEDSPFVDPLPQAMPRERWAILLVNRRTGRIFRGTPERLEEVGTVRDIVHGWHDQGGWSQARYQRGIEKEIQDHVKHSCEVLFDLYKQEPFQRLVVGAPKELCPEVESTLHTYLRGLIAGRVDVDVEHSKVEEVRRAVMAVVEADEQRRERQTLDRLAQGVGTGRAVAGLEPVLHALNDRRVESLLHERGFRAPGVACPACGWLGVSGKECPLDGAEVARREDIMENAVELAVAQSAGVVVVGRHEVMKQMGSVGALLRF